MKLRQVVKIAILDDYQNVALSIADWSAVAKKADITVFNDHIDQTDALIERLLPFDVICVMRERTPLRRDIIERLPRLRFIASTGPRNVSIDMTAANERGILVANTGYRSTPTIELTWALILASARHLVGESNSIRGGGWQTLIGHELDGRVLGVLGLGNVGGQVARIGCAFGMKIIAWSQNLTAEAAAAASAELVTKDELFRRADVVTIHLVLSERTRGLVGAAELALMKPTARLVNTSRGPIVDELALIETLRARTIAGAAVDVFDTEPLAAQHPFRSLATCWRRRISDSSPRISTGLSAATRRRRSEPGSRSRLRACERQKGRAITAANPCPEYSPGGRRKIRTFRKPRKAGHRGPQALRRRASSAKGMTIMGKLQGKVALVTGGTTGIGFRHGEAIRR
jgi:phosphoglycerate dehydrogenase-like enzyme